MKKHYIDRRILTLIALLFFVMSSSYAQNYGFPYLNLGDDQTYTCYNPANALAKINETGKTDTYQCNLSPDSFPFIDTGKVIIPFNSNNIWSNTINIPFDFCFYDSAYSQLTVGSNGLLSFNTSLSGTLCNAFFSDQIPSVNLPFSSIMGAYVDLSPNTGGEVYYQIIGNAPSRALVITYDSVPLTSCNNLSCTQHIVLYETTNIIDVYIEDKPLCLMQNNGNSVIGIQDANGTSGIAAAARNTSAWDAQNETWRFRPNGTSTTSVVWYDTSGTVLNTGLAFTSIPENIYIGVLTYVNCNNDTVQYFDTLVITEMPPVSITISANPPVVCPCVTGSTTLTVVGDSGPYTWSTGQTGSSISGDGGSSYTVTGVNPCGGCPPTASITIPCDDPFIFSTHASKTHICSGEAVNLSIYPIPPSTLTSSVSGWFDNFGNYYGSSSQITVTPTTTTIYEIGAINGCCPWIMGSETIHVYPKPIITTNTSSNNICPGETIQLSASSSTAVQNYHWSNGAVGSTISVSPMSTTTYTVTATSTNGCTSSSNISINVVPSPNIILSPNPSVICTGMSANISASGAQNYSWSHGLPSASSNNVSPTSTTTYSVTGTSSYGCTASSTVSITVENNPIINTFANPSEICLGDTTTLQASSNVNNTSYSWSHSLGNGFPNVSPSSNTTYIVTATTSGGCSATANLSIFVKALPVISAYTTVDSICQGDTTSIFSQGGITYSWDNGVGIGSSHEVCPQASTIYTVTGTSANSCSASANISITVRPLPNISIGANPDTICELDSTVIFVSGNYFYNWDNGLNNNSSHKVSPTMSTVYTVTATDNNGCSASRSKHIVVNPKPQPILYLSPDSICLGDSSMVSASGASSYLWDNGLGFGNNLSVSPITSTNYHVTATSIHGCTTTANILLEVLPKPSLTITSIPDTLCFGDTANLFVSGAVNYSWSHALGNNSSVFVNPALTTTYSVTGTDSHNCYNVRDFTLHVNNLPTVVINADKDTICVGDSINLFAIGAMNYIWSNNLGTGSNQLLYPDSSTIYTVTGTDVNGCSSDTSIQIMVNALPNVIIFSDDTICKGNSRILVANGANNYLWSNGVMSDSIIVFPLLTSTYSVIGTDTNACINYDTIFIKVIDPPLVSLSALDEHCNRSDGEVQANIQGGSGIYNIEWNTNPVSIQNPLQNIPQGTYEITIFDHGCIVKDTINVHNIPGPTANYSIDPNKAYVNEILNFIDASIGASSWTWYFGDGISSNNYNPTYSYSIPGKYTTVLHVTDDHLCEDSSSIIVHINRFFSFYIPNSFSPNNDMVNDVFKPYGTGIDEDQYILQIYDRWGNMVFETKDFNQGWDGSINNNQVIDEYKGAAIFNYYIYVVEKYSNADHEYRGSITMIK